MGSQSLVVQEELLAVWIVKTAEKRAQMHLCKENRVGALLHSVYFKLLMHV